MKKEAIHNVGINLRQFQTKQSMLQLELYFYFISLNLIYHVLLYHVILKLRNKVAVLFYLQQDQDPIFAGMCPVPLRHAWS